MYPKEHLRRSMTEEEKELAFIARDLIKRFKFKYKTQYFEKNTENHSILKYYDLMDNCGDIDIYNSNHRYNDLTKALQNHFPLVQIKTNAKGITYLIVFTAMPKRINMGYFDNYKI